MSLSAQDIQNLVPHRGRMLLVNTLDAHDRTSISTSFAMTADSPFCCEQGVPVICLLEYAAQSCAIHRGLLGGDGSDGEDGGDGGDGGDGPRMLVKVTEFDFITDATHMLPGQIIHCTGTLVHSYADLAEYRCELSSEGLPVAATVFTVFHGVAG